MNSTLQAQIEAYLSRLQELIRRGHELRDLLAAAPTDQSVIMANRLWQQDCGVVVTELSGSSKAHWLARALSQAFLQRASDGTAVEGVAASEITDRLVGVLEQAASSLSRRDEVTFNPESSPAPAPKRFEFVHDAELRPVVEQAFIDSKRAFEAGRYDLALKTSCGILEAIVTDALQHKGLSALLASGAPTGEIGEWSFNTRLAVAERAGLIRNGAARLPEVARAYRDEGASAAAEISEQDAKRTAQVLNVIMRDLDPGR
jgi:hypothetical protein